MDKENNILHPKVFDFTIFPISDTEKVFKEAEGSNHRKLMVVYAIESDPKEDLSFLSKVLGAVKIDLQKDIHLLGLTKEQNLSFGHLKSLCEIETIIVFGRSPKDLGISLVASPYQVVKTEDCTFLFANALGKVAAKKELKGSLWAALKEIFDAGQ